MRVKRGPGPRRRHKAVLAEAKGFYGSRRTRFKEAVKTLRKAWEYQYTSRKLKKRDFRSLWIVRIGAAARANGLSYSQFMHGLKLAEINLDRKVLADLAVHEPAAFTEISGKVKQAIESRRATAA